MTKHLSLLSILHYVYGAFICLVGTGMFFFISMGLLLAGGSMAELGEEPPPAWFPGFMQAFGGILLVMVLVWGGLIMLSGYWISKRRNRVASIVIAALCLLSFPFGTALGIFALMALADDGVKQAYEAGTPFSQGGVPGV